MDLNPTFGHQELFETLSRGSSEGHRSPNSSITAGSRPPAGTTAYKSTSSSNRSGNTNDGSARGGGGGGRPPSSHVDEAYRRLGQRLSLQAHGQDSPDRNRQQRGGVVVPIPRTLTPSNSCSFDRYSRRRAAATTGRNNDNSASSDNMSVEEEALSGQPAFRIQKVAKTRYSDHGEHEEHYSKSSITKRSSRGLLKKLSYHAKDSFRLWEQVQQTSHKKALAHQQQNAQQQTQQHPQTQQRQPQHQQWPDASLSPQRYAFSQLDLAEATSNGGAGGQHYPPHRGGTMRRGPGTFGGNSEGLLSAVMEGHSDSAATSMTGNPAPSVRSTTSPSQSISTKDSRITVSTMEGGNSVRSRHLPSQVRGECLTLPADPSANEGMDNVDGNLIVFENDIIKVPHRGLHSLNAEDKGRHRSAEYRVRGALGQGTFAQVFRCLHVQSGREVALKIVKNKPAYTRQATVEIDVFRALQEDDNNSSTDGNAKPPTNREYMVNLLNYFMHRSHLCLVFELLGLNLYDVLKRRQFRGLPLPIVRTILHQAVEGIRELSQKKGIIHCDLKPENVLLVSDDVGEAVVRAGEVRRPANSKVTPSPEEIAATLSSAGGSMGTISGASSTANTVNTAVAGNIASSDKTGMLASRQIKLIDFGSACFEGHTAHTYIQSRFYRSPEVLIGVPYDSAIDIWSLGCVAAELYLGLPILPGVHEHDQMGRISEMVTKAPDWMLEQGSKASKYYVKFVSRVSRSSPPEQSGTGANSASPAPPLPQWRLKTQEEYISSLSQSEIKKKGGMAKLQKQPGNRYFKLKKLCDILMLHGKNVAAEEKDGLRAFVHFLYGLLDPDPWKRWTAFQAVQHPFITGDLSQLKKKSNEMKLDPKEENNANLELDLYWRAPWDPAICRRKLLNVQKMREKQDAVRRGMSSRSHGQKSEMTPPRIPRTPHAASNDRYSPPNQIAGMPSSNRNHIPGQPEFTSGYAMSSSLNSLGQPGATAQFAMESTSVVGQASFSDRGAMMGPQSFTSVGYGTTRAPDEGDFAYALQRPGVVPGTGTDASIASHSTTWNSQQHGIQSQTGGWLPTGAPVPGQGLSQGQMNSHVGAGPYGMQVPSSFGSYGSQYGTSATVPSTSVSSSVTMPDNASQGFSGQGGPYMNPQQFAMLQQQHQQTGAIPQTGQQGQVMMQQQQPVYLAPGAPGGGYYYVTTSATGQPIVLQPVGMLNQQVNDSAGVPNQPYGMQQQQQQLPVQQPYQPPGLQFQQPQQQQNLQFQQQQFQQPIQQFQQPIQQFQQPRQQPMQQFQQQNQQALLSSGADPYQQQRTMQAPPQPTSRDSRNRYRGAGGGTSM